MNNWSKRPRIPLNVPHPNSPAGGSFDWSSLGVPHPNSPAGRNFDYLSSTGMPHPNSPAGKMAIRQLEASSAAMSTIPITGAMDNFAQAGIFMNLLPFAAASVDSVPAEEGVYIVYKNGVPFYVGRSRVDIQGRLRSHLKGTGSRKIASEPRNLLQFEYCNLASLEQAEAILIRELDTRKIGNMRFETDPADWKVPCRVCNSNKCTDYEDRTDGGSPTVASVAAGTAICRCGHNYKEHE